MTPTVFTRIYVQVSIPATRRQLREEEYAPRTENSRRCGRCTTRHPTLGAARPGKTRGDGPTETLLTDSGGYQCSWGMDAGRHTHTTPRGELCMENLEYAEAERRRRRRPYGNLQPTLHGLRAGCEAVTGSTETSRKHLHYGWFETQQQIYSWFRTHRERLTRTAFETTSRCFRRSHRCQTNSGI